MFYRGEEDRRVVVWTVVIMIINLYLYILDISGREASKRSSNRCSPVYLTANESGDAGDSGI